ncbi:MAG: BatD family protein [candidate division Zixibacteria bacterium]|nr:BatD family protein [candidate division Zixibacteria bacterium]MDH3937883.1 BatD family protein [candidate division Zixibacteria bacterium]MDH4034615.1 BatD family protein [candidate division Zixibacteria bacterium]
MTTAVMAADEITVGVTLDRTTIGMDEQALLQVQVAGSVQNLPEPQLPTLPTFEIYSKGRSSNISIANGVVESSLIYRYLVIPRKAGKFPIDNISVVHNNKRYKGNMVMLTVLNRGSSASDDINDRSLDSKGDSKDYFLEAVVDKKDPYVNEQVTLTLKFYIAVQYYGSPELTEPTTTGFWTEVLGNKAPYYQSLNNRRYRLIERKYALFPTQTGELTIGRATIRATVAGKRRRSRDPFGSFNLDDFFGRGVEARASSQPLRINVKPIPQENRPADFTGTIGRFKIKAEADKRQVEVNEPVTVKFRISGTGNIKSVAEPVLSEMDEFRIYRASSSESVSQQNDKLGGTKVFEEVFIPRVPGDLVIPSVAFNYFDPDRDQYNKVATQPIQVTVTAPAGYSGSSGVPYSAPGLTIDSRAHDIRHIKAELGKMQATGHLPVFNYAYVLANFLPLVGLITTVLVRRRREKLAADTGRARARGAAKIAKKRLAQARALANLDSVGEFYVEIYRALTSYLADKLNISPHGLTTDTIRQELAERLTPEELIESYTGVITQCDYARFASAALTQSDIDRTLKQSEEVIIRIEGVKLA